MTIYNMSVVFAPCLMRPKIAGYKDLEKSSNTINFLITLIEKSD